MASPLDQLQRSPTFDSPGPEFDDANRFRLPSEVESGKDFQTDAPIADAIPGPIQQRVNRFKAEDLATRGIPMYTTASGDVAPIKDDTGASLTSLDARNNIAYDSKGQPKEIVYGEKGPPTLTDPFATLPSRVNPDTGAIEKYGKGLYQYEGQDQATTAKVLQENNDKLLAKQSALIGRKLTLDEHDLTVGEKEHKAATNDLMGQVPTLRDPKFEGADQATVLKAIDEHFNTEYASSEANATKGWFGSEPSPEATALRADIDARKAKAIDTAQNLYALKDHLNGLTETVGAARDTERQHIETLLAHSRGETGPLDIPASSVDGKPATNGVAAKGLYPPGEDQARMLGGQKLEPDKMASDPVATVKSAIDTGGVPAPIAPASLAASNDAADAFQKAKDLANSNPTLADQFKAAGEGIISGLTRATGESLRGPLRHLIDINSFGLTHVVGKLQPSGPQSIAEEGTAIEKMGAVMDPALKDTVGAKIGNFIGGVVPYVAAAIATKGASIAPALMGGLFFNSGYQSTYEDAKAKGASEGKATGAALAVGAVNGLLAMPLGVVGKAYQAIFGDTTPKVIQTAVEAAFKNDGAAGLEKMLEKLKGAIAGGEKPILQGAAQDVRAQTIKAIENIQAEVNKSAAQRLLDVAKTTATHAAIGGGVQAAENQIVQKTYDPNRGTFEGVPEQALGFGVLAGLSKGFEQVVAARRAKQFLDTVNAKSRGLPPGEPPAPESPKGPEPKGPTPAEPPMKQANAKVVSPEPTVGSADTSKGGETVEPKKESPKGATEATTPKNGVLAPAPASESNTALATAEDRFVSEGGHADKLDAQNKLAALREAFPDPAERMKAIEERLSAPASNEAPSVKLPTNVERTFAQAEEFRAKGDHVTARAVMGSSPLAARGYGEPWTPAEQKEINRRKAEFLAKLPGAKATTIDQAAHEAATSPKNELTEPTQAQKEAGNYQKGHVNISGLDISIENPAGTKRKPEFAPLTAHYGYIKGTVGADKDHVDIFVAQKTPADYQGPVFVVNQHNQAGGFDEHKAIIGPKTAADAKALYQEQYQKGWTGGKSVVEFANPTEFKKWATSGAKGQPAFDPRLPIAHGKLVSSLHLTYGGKTEAGHLFHDTSTDRPTTFAIQPPTAERPFSAQLQAKVNEVRAKSGSPAESKVAKLAMGAMKKHAETLATLGHSTIPKLGVTESESGVQAKTEGGKSVITIDPKKLAKATEGLNERAQSKFVQRAIEEEILHVAGETWERQSPENADKVKEWGKSPDELSKFLSESYEGWEDLSDRQKGHEKIRAVLQKRWTGKLTEAAYRVLKEFLKYLRGIYEKLTPAQRAIVDGVEAVLKGEPKPKASNEASLIERSRKAHEEYVAESKKRGLSENIKPEQFDEAAEIVSDNPERFHPVREIENAKGLKIGDRVVTKSGDEGIIVSFDDAGTGGVKPKVSIFGSYGGFYPLDDVNKIGTPEATAILDAAKEKERNRALPSLWAEPTTKLEKRANQLITRYNALEGVKPTARAVIETLIRAKPSTAGLNQLESKIAKLEEKNAVQEPSPTGLLQHPPSGAGEQGGGQVESGEQGPARAPETRPEGTAGEAGAPPALDDKASKALDDAFEGLFAALPSRLTPDKGKAVTLLEGVLDNKFPTWRRTPKEKLPEKAQALIGQLMKQYSRTEALGAAKPVLEQQAIPMDKIGGIVAAAQELVRQNVDTPEKLAAVLESRYKGKARPFSQALWDMIGTVKPSLRGTHDWAAIYLASTKASDEAGAPAIKPQTYNQLTQAVVAALKTGPLTRKQLTELASETGMTPKAIDEAAELGIVYAARDIAHGEGTPEQKFDQLVVLYDRQPNLTAKTSTSKVNQAYSTPAPLAYVAGVLAGLNDLKVVAYEPTAGNGLLTIAGDPKHIEVNEMDPKRAAALKLQGFRHVSEKDALKVVHMAKFGAIIANPPFGTILDDNGNSIDFPLYGTGGETTKNIDQAISLQALDSMADDGRAVLIIGGKNIKDPEERAKAYATPNQMKFWKPLYEQYRVVDHFTVDGDLYSKQGAGWPVDVIMIAGRGRSPIQLPSADGPRIIGSWDELKAELSRTDQDRIDAGRYDAERDRAKVGGIIGAIRQLAEPEPATGAKGDIQRAETPNGGARSSSDLSPGDQGERPIVSGGPESGAVDRSAEPGRVGTELHPVESEQRGQQLEDFRVPYKPASKFPSFGIFVPTNMEAPAREALARLEQKAGPVDAYVREKLGYAADAPIERYFSAEQMDALALGINAVENKTAFVLGDQGGVGKGRVAAGMMRYAIKQGKVPIFITKDVKLYAAMIEDLHDIGSDDIVPMFTDNNIAFRDYSETQWKQGTVTKVMQEIARTGKLPAADALFTTYNQIQADAPARYSASKAERAALKAAHRAPPDGARMEALKKLAPNSIIIADESHLAAGDSIRAWRLHPLLAMAHGVYYSSATFAKRPDSLGIYNRTSLSPATNSIDDLVDAMKQGGVPLQQVVSATLAADGLYLRRERDFGKAVFHTHINLDTKDRDTQLADNYTDGLRSILGISNKMKEAKDLLNRLMRREGKKLQVDNPPRIETTNFASKLHNMIGQYLFAIKAESAVRRAVEGVTKGFTNKEGVTSPHKIIIAFQNTMQAPILNLEHSHRPLTFNGMLLSYLDTQRVLTSGRGPNAQTITITDKPDPNFEDTPDHLLEKMLVGSPKLDPLTGETSASVNEPALAEMFRRIMSGVFKTAEAKIEALELADMPLSPIDHIRHKLAQAGVKTGEITGRSIGIDEDGALYNIDPSTHTKAAHLRTLTDFNNSDTDVLLMNASGSTGISAHASPKFKRKDPRAMLILQGHLDINEFMQTLWRIDRTGQIHQPYYENLQTALPAELRPAAIRGKKMAKLNANTTSNAESEISEGNKGVDIFNQYGDEVVHNYLRTDPTFTRMLDFVNIVDDNGYILPLADVLAQYEENGQFAAAVTGRAAVLPTAEQEAFWEKVMADYVAHIDYLNELGENELVSDTVDLKAETLEAKELTPAKQGDSGFDASSTLEKIKADIGLKPLPATEVIAMMEKLGAEAYDLRQGWQAKADAWKANELARLKEKVLSWDDAKAASYEARWREQEEEINAAIGLIGDGLHLKTDKGLDGYGAITSVHFDDEHPLTPSKQIFTVHVNTTKKTIRVPASQLPTIARLAVGDFHDVYEASAERSNQRYMITGNLLAAYLAIRDSAPTAKIVQYTTDKGDLRQGILMPGKFSPGSLEKKRVVDSPKHMLELLLAGRSLTNAGGEVTLVKAPSGGFVMRVPASRTQGGAYWRDSQLARLMDGGEFVERGGAMVGKFTLDNSHLVYQRLLDLNATLFYTDQGDGTALHAARPVRAAVAFKDSVTEQAKSVGMGVVEALRMVQHLVSPTAGVAMDAHDRVMKMLGDRNQKAYETDRVLEAASASFDAMTRPEQIAFIDNMKLGKPQASPELQAVAATMRKIDTESWEAAQEAYRALGFKDPPLSWLENHYRVLWKKIPGDTSEEKSEWIGRAKRGLRGSMGQHKQHTLDTMSDGLTMGGVPYSYNPVVMFKLAQADLWKLTTTLQAWKWAKENGFVEFVRGAFPQAPAGMVELDDSIARVYFPAESGEGLIQGGKYFVEEGFGRLLNNYLSKDFIRQTKIGRGLLWLKNASTAIELSLSVFHGVFETLEAIGSNIGLGLSQLVNRGLLKGDLGAAGNGLKNIITSIASPVTGFSLGQEIRKAAGDPDTYFKTAAGKKMLASYPRSREMIDDLFAGGWKPTELEQDWKNNSIRTFLDSVEDIRAGSSDNYVGAGLRAFPAANEFLMKPLFDYYIPSLKVAQFFKEYAEAIEQNERKLKGGILTRTALARQVWRLVEDRFGELNYDTLFWNSNFKTAMQLMFRSVTWKLGSVEAFAGAFGGQAKEFRDAIKERRAPELHRNMAWLFGMFLLTATLGYIISKTMAGKDPKDLKDYVFPQIDPKDDKVRVSIPTYFKDMVHLIHAPVGYVTSSMSGWIGRLADLLRNKDYYGVQIRDTDDSLAKQAMAVGKYSAGTLLPFSVRGYKNLATQDVNTLRKLLAVVGVNPAPRFIGQTPAERASAEYWQNQRAEGGVRPEQFEVSGAKRLLVKQIQHGENPNISEALAKGTIKPRDVKGLYERATTSALEAQVKHMPLEEAERIYDKGTTKEKRELESVMATKRANRYKRDRTPFKGF